MLAQLGNSADCDLTAARVRAEYLYARKFSLADAAHVAFAEATTDVFISCDGRLVWKCRRENISVVAMNPVGFAIEEDLK